MDIVEEMCCILIKFIYCMCVIISEKRMTNSFFKTSLGVPFVQFIFKYCGIVILHHFLLVSINFLQSLCF